MSEPNTKTRLVRYCILCGLEIGEATHCPNPECGGIPNFYRFVPGPESSQRPGDGKNLHRGKVASARARGSTDPVAPHDEPPRMTIPVAVSPVAVLRAVAAPHDEHYLFAGKTLVGARSPARIVIDLREISSRHATIGCREGKDGQPRVAIVDHDSTNGTFVNGKRTQRAKLQEGDRIRFANVEFELRLVSTGEGPPRATMQL
ncbi:MAG: FHA domain-containing protein [Planctomycetota bacterium]|nr:FHA domain-containing protein [Planctomycetota bacterium]